LQIRHELRGATDHHLGLHVTRPIAGCLFNLRFDAQDTADDRSFGPREAGYLADLGLLPGLSARRDYLSVASRPASLATVAAIPRFALDADPSRFMQVASGVERLKLRIRP
jgi:hypothetical protein